MSCVCLHFFYSKHSSLMKNLCLVSASTHSTDMGVSLLWIVICRVNVLVNQIGDGASAC